MKEIFEEALAELTEELKSGSLVAEFPCSSGAGSSSTAKMGEPETSKKKKKNPCDEPVHMHVQLSEEIVQDFFNKCKRSRGTKDPEPTEEDDDSTQVLGESPVRPSQPVQPVGGDDVNIESEHDAGYSPTSESESVKSQQPSPYKSEHLGNSNEKPAPDHGSDSDGGIESVDPWPHGEEGEQSESETSDSDSEVECGDVSAAVSWLTFIILYKFQRNPEG